MVNMCTSLCSPNVHVDEQCVYITNVCTLFHACAHLHVHLASGAMCTHSPHCLSNVHVGKQCGEYVYISPFAERICSVVNVCILLHSSNIYMLVGE